MKTDKKFPLDMALEVIEEKIFDNPEALNCLKQLEKLHGEIDNKTAELNRIQDRYDDVAKDMLDILDLLGCVDYCLPNKFRAYTRTRREVEIIDAPAFMSWLKATFEPAQVMHILTPPTTKLDFKKFCERYLDEHGGEIPGVDTKATFVNIKTDYKGFTRVKKRSNYKTTRRKRFSTK